MLNLKDMNYYSEDIGSVIKSTLHEYRWDFTIENKEVFIQLYDYRISNIRKVVYNQKVLREEHAKNENYYSFEFIMDGHHYKIIQSTGDIAQLYIDDISFDYIYTLDRNKREFEGNKVGKICDICGPLDRKTMDGSKIRLIILRYSIATLGLALVALGVALSLKSEKYVIFILKKMKFNHLMKLNFLSMINQKNKR